MRVQTLVGGTMAICASAAVAIRLGTDHWIDDKRRAQLATREGAQHRLDTETLTAAERHQLEAKAATRVTPTATTPLLVLAGLTAIGLGVGLGMADMGGGFATGWAKPNAALGAATAGILAGVALSTGLDRN